MSVGFPIPLKQDNLETMANPGQNCIAAATYWAKLTPYMSHKASSAKKKFSNVTAAQLEDQTCHPPNPHFRWGAFRPVGFVHKVILYLSVHLFQFPPNPHFSWWSFSHIGFVHKVILYLREELLQFPPNRHFRWRQFSHNGKWVGEPD